MLIEYRVRLTREDKWPAMERRVKELSQRYIAESGDNLSTLALERVLGWFMSLPLSERMTEDEAKWIKAKLNKR